MEVLGREKFGAAILEPFSAGKRLAFWAMAIRAGVIRVALMAAPVALFEMTTKNGVRQASIAVITRRCATDSEAPCCRR
jgi:hypothetical protein